jgi:hypothetical protein
MEATIWIFLAVAATYGVFRFLRRRADQEAERKARADQRAKIARDDAKAFRRTLDGRR